MKINAGLYIDVKSLSGKLLRHSDIQSDTTVKRFMRNSKHCLFLLVGRQHEPEIVTFDKAIFKNGQSEKYSIQTDVFNIEYWYMKN